MDRNKDPHDTLVRSALYGEAPRESGVLLVILGPIVGIETRTLSVPLVLAIWAVASIMLWRGVELEVSVKRVERSLS
jgi:type IV secretory pathway TrbD component